MDWSRPPRRASRSPASFQSNSTIRHEWMVAASSPGTRTERDGILLDDERFLTVGLSVLPKTPETASEVTGDLRERYDIFLLGSNIPTSATTFRSLVWARGLGPVLFVLVFSARYLKRAPSIHAGAPSGLGRPSVSRRSAV